MSKIKLKDIILENGFEGAPGGGGSLNYGGSYGTPNSSTQDTSKFSSSDKTTNHMASNTESTSSAMMQPTERPDRIDSRNNNPSSVISPDKMGKNTVSPAANYDVQKSQVPLNPEQELDPKVDQLFKGKKQTPSPDEIMSAVQYELANMVKKDKMIAKQTVLKNMKNDPHHYSNLQNLNIDDDKMKVTENSTTDKFFKTVAVLDEMIAEKQKSVAIANTPEISQIFKDLLKRRRGM